jgi:cell division protein FtsW (lipid II flippase)
VAYLSVKSSVLGPRRGGMPLGRLWKQLAIATNWPMLVAVAVLSALGVLSIWADSRADGVKQLIFLGVGVACMAAFQAISYQKIGRVAWLFYGGSLALILYTVAAAKIHLPLARPIKGQCNWINFGPVSLQPAELMKIAFVLVMARYLRFRNNYRTLTGLLPPFVLAGVPLLAILKQPDLGTALIFVPCLFTMLFVAGAKGKHLLLIFALGAGLATFGWLSGTDRPVFRHLPEVVKKYQRDRVYAMFADDPGTLRSTGFQQHNALIAFGSGGVAGKGIGNIPVGEHVPEGHNDMIFALIGEQFGFFGSAVVLAAYIVLFTAGVEIAGSTREPFGRLVALGVVSMLAGQTFLNILVAVKLMPVTGVTLPFISYGGSSLIASFMAVGLLLNIGQNRPMVMANDSFEFDG